MTNAIEAAARSTGRSRRPASPHPATTGVSWAVHTGALGLLALVCVAFATRAFRAYQRSP